MYGGTGVSRRRTNGVLNHGLSPRVRGNPRSEGRARICGEVYPRVYGGTLARADFRHLWEVYPRVYGGTARRDIRACKRVYPRVYGGTHSARIIRDGSTRSIPACTGEPMEVSLARGPWSELNKVYPRVYGGTWAT